jgi:hypothetical protein
MSDPISLRKIPPEALKLAQELSTQTGLSINDVFRLALASGLLVEVTKVTPKPDGTLAGLPSAFLAKALRRHLGAAIDLLLEYGEHPYQILMKARQEEWPHGGTDRVISPGGMPRNESAIASSIGDDLDGLGIGLGLSETLQDQK